VARRKNPKRLRSRSKNPSLQLLMMMILIPSLMRKRRMQRLRPPRWPV